MRSHDTSVQPDEPAPDERAPDLQDRPEPVPQPDAVPASGAEHADGPANTPQAAVDSSSRWLRRVLVLFVVAMTVQWVRLTRQGPDPPVIERGAAYRQLFRVNVNEATWVEWLQLEGIGQSLAHRIVADREINGPFRSIDDLTRVTGIGPKTLDRIRPWLTITHAHDTARPGDAAEFESRSDFHAR